MDNMECYVCRNEVVNGEEITVGPAEHLCEDVVVCMNCKLNWLEGIQRARVKIAEEANG
tara:strand:- start:8231 stop:8407 length:177 start_codon:yes stop_codon:yes gene_type:complete